MKVFAYYLSLILSLCVCNAAVAAPMLTDEIPQEYINKVKSQKKVEFNNTITDYEKETAIPVKVYSPENIRIKFRTRFTNLTLVYIVTNIKVNDSFTFRVAEDVYKNDKLFIAKDTPAKGYVEKIQITAINYGPPPEFKLSYFTTKDVNNNTIKLKGSVINDYSGPIQNLRHGINKNKVYTLYCK